MDLQKRTKRRAWSVLLVSTFLTNILNKLRLELYLGIRGGTKSELYNYSKQILLVSSRGTLVSRLLMSKVHILSGNKDSLRRLSKKLN